MALLAIVLFIGSNIYQTLSVKPVDSEVVCLYDEWTKPVEKIESEQRLFELVPRQSRTENNILLHLYSDECTEGLSHPLFAGAHYQTGPAVLHLAQMNYSITYPNIFSDWNLPSNCSLFIMIPIDKTYADHQQFSVLKDVSLPSFSAWIHSNRGTQVHFVNNFGSDVKFYWYEKNPKFLGIFYFYFHHFSTC